MCNIQLLLILASHTIRSELTTYIEKPNGKGRRLIIPLRGNEKGFVDDAVVPARNGLPPWMNGPLPSQSVIVVNSRLLDEDREGSTHGNVEKRHPAVTDFKMRGVRERHEENRPYQPS